MRLRLRLGQTFWSLHSRTWDDALVDEAVREHISALVGWLADSVAPGTLVADLGCGTGNHAIALQSRGLRAVGLDHAPGMLSRAAAKRDRMGKRTALVRADLSDRLPLADRAVGAALSVFCVQLVDPRLLFGEVARVLRPGGLFLVEGPRADVRSGRPGPQMSRRYRWFDRGKRVVGFVARRVGAVRRQREKDLREALVAAGFEPLGERVTDRSLAMLSRLEAD